MRTLLVVVAGIIGAGTVRGAEPFEGFIEKHCVRCHGPQKKKGELRIDQLSRDFKSGTDAQRWAEVIEQINSGAMPPKGESKPTQAEIAEFVSAIDTRVKESRAARMAARPPVAHYRLSRKEYQNTVYDLLGVRYDPTKPGELNEDSLWHGYERIGSQLTLSPSHVDRYFRAAETVLDRAFPVADVEARKVRKTAAELRYNGGKEQQAALERFGIKRPLRALLYPGTVHHALSPNWFGKTGPEHSGLYKMRVQASGIRPPGGQVAHLSIGKRTGEETVNGLIEFDLTAPEDKPQVYEFEVFLEMPASLDFCVVATNTVDRRAGAAFRNALNGGSYVFTHSSETLLLNPNAPQMFDGKGNGLFSTVLLDWIEWEGPIVTGAEKSRRAGFVPPENATPEVVAEHLQRFAERAWRRPVKREELADHLRAYRLEREAGEKVAAAYRVAMQGVLTSRHFIYLVEGAPAARDRLTDTELASRLSYFLWSSMPDDALLAAAKDGLLLKGDGVGRVVDRMLQDGKANRFVDDFTRQWLQLHRLGMFPPDKTLYPTYDAWLETSLRAEPVEYVRELYAKNLPLDQLIDSDWTMANARLCDFYGLPEPKAAGFQRAALKPELHRGGLLTMGAVLGLTSDGTRHRPVHRGVWVSEVVFNKTPPPPPANVSAIEPNPPNSPKATVRQKIEAHRNNANCAACHARIDPLGIAWDNYDAIGQWRTREKVAKGLGEDPLIDASGVMPDGRPFKDSVEFKRVLLADRDAIARAFIEHLCTYALRRVLTVDDQDDITAIVSEAKKNHYRVRDVVRAVALSDLMRKR
jgi:hypothetical protein